MSGHNKWSKIKHKKAAEDAKKSKEYSKFARLLTLESKKAQGNVESPGLRKAIDRARAINMPASNIERAVKKGTGQESAHLEEVIYEAYGPGGSALIIHGSSDNKNRTSAEIKHLLAKYATSLAAKGSASWAFEHTDDEWSPKTLVSLSRDDKSKLNSLVEELEEHNDVQSIYTNAN